MAKMGQPEFNYDAFKQAYDTDPSLKAIVHRFDDNGVELKSKMSRSDMKDSGAEKAEKTVSQMAKRATDKALG